MRAAQTPLRPRDTLQAAVVTLTQLQSPDYRPAEAGERKSSPFDERRDPRQWFEQHPAAQTIRRPVRLIDLLTDRMIDPVA
jgi:hypothetical protein